MTTEHSSKETVNIPAICALLREMDTTGAEVNLHNIAALLEQLDRENVEMLAERIVLNERGAKMYAEIERLERENADLTRVQNELHEKIYQLRDRPSVEPKEDKSLVELVRLFEEAAIAWQRHHGAWETDRLIYQRNAVLMALRYSKSLETNDPLVQCRCGWQGKQSALKPLPDFKSGCPDCSQEFKPLRIRLSNDVIHECNLCGHPNAHEPHWCRPSNTGGS